MTDYIITGCTGAIGTALINKIISNGEKVIAVLNPQSERNGNVPDSPLIKKIFCGIDDYSQLPENASEKCDVFFHLAWRGASGAGRNDEQLQLSNVENTLSAVKAAKKLGCRKFVFIGSQAEYGRVNYGKNLAPDTPCSPETEYGKKKLSAAEKAAALCIDLGFEFIHVRVLSVYGRFDGENALIPYAIKSLQNGVRPEYTKGEQIWDYLFSEDAANALNLIAEKGVPFKTYVLGSGKAKPLKEYLATLHSIVAPDIPPVFGEKEYAPNQVMYLTADISELTKDTGFIPKTSFEDGIKKIVLEGSK